MKLTICNDCGKVKVNHPNQDCYWCGSVDVEVVEEVDG